jgi:hypothetical protein
MMPICPKFYWRFPQFLLSIFNHSIASPSPITHSHTHSLTHSLTSSDMMVTMMVVVVAVLLAGVWSVKATVTPDYVCVMSASEQCDLDGYAVGDIVQVSE